jgi:AcrR family transcriptional regulator
MLERSMPPATPAARARTRKPYHHGDLRRALIDHAVTTIRRHGVDALTLRSAGSELGVSRTALYRHFADKAALLAAVAIEGFRMLRVELVAAWEAGGQGRPGFERMGAAYIRFAVRNPSHYRVMFGGFVDQRCADPELTRVAAEAFQALVDALQEQQRAGLVRADDPGQLALFVWAAVHGVAMLAIDGQLAAGAKNVDTLTAFAIERLRTGIAADQSRDATRRGRPSGRPDRRVTPNAASRRST